MQVLVSEVPNPQLEQVLEAGLDAHGAAVFGESAPLRQLQVSCADSAGVILGGLLGNTGNGWLHIWALWVAEAHRGQGLGSQLLAAAEGEAIARGCTKAHVETLSFQAPGFYLARGYAEFGILPDYVGPHAQHFLRKTLVS